MISSRRPPRLDAAQLRAAARHLGARDGDLLALLRSQGPPPLWGRPAGFRTLIKIILEQQVSLASGAAVYRRLEERIQPFTPERVAGAGVSGLRSLGVTRQKADYCVHLAEAILGGRLDLDALRRMDDSAASAALTRLKGIGPWTAQIYLLMALRRPDVWPSGDLALVRTIQVVKRLRRSPSPARMLTIAEAWRPYRAVAARMLWQHYLAR
ncbi:MAG TPA: DNA-3-methyladenine glycosylase 2 family protein [Patescibacteria group bacterium]|nr:DNA-3-methyladenine glycosylase 2 family protein [Patescibacteria group bacterium]